MATYLPVKRLLDIARRFGWQALRAVEPRPDILLLLPDELGEGSLTTGQMDSGQERVVLHPPLIQRKLSERQHKNFLSIQPTPSHAPGMAGARQLTDTEAKRFGEVVKEYRGYKKLDQAQLGVLVGTSAQNIGKIERGETRKSGFAPDICVILDIPEEKLPKSLKDLVVRSRATADVLHLGVTTSIVAGNMTDKDKLVLEGLINKYRKLGGAKLVIRTLLDIDARLEADGTNP